MLLRIRMTSLFFGMIILILNHSIRNSDSNSIVFADLINSMYNGETFEADEIERMFFQTISHSLRVPVGCDIPYVSELQRYPFTEMIRNYKYEEGPSQQDKIPIYQVNPDGENLLFSFSFMTSPELWKSYYPQRYNMKFGEDGVLKELTLPAAEYVPYCIYGTPILKAGMLIRHYPLSVPTTDHREKHYVGHGNPSIHAITSSTGEVLSPDYYDDDELKHFGRLGIVKEIYLVSTNEDVGVADDYHMHQRYAVVLTDGYIVPLSSKIIIYDVVDGYQHGYFRNSGTIGFLRDFTKYNIEVSTYNFEEDEPMLEPVWTFLVDRMYKMLELSFKLGSQDKDKEMVERVGAVAIYYCTHHDHDHSLDIHYPTLKEFLLQDKEEVVDKQVSTTTADAMSSATTTVAGLNSHDPVLKGESPQDEEEVVEESSQDKEEVMDEQVTSATEDTMSSPATTTVAGLNSRPRLQESTSLLPWWNSSFFIARVLIPIVKEWLGPSPHYYLNIRIVTWKYLELDAAVHRGRMTPRFAFDWTLVDYLDWRSRENILKLFDYRHQPS